MMSIRYKHMICMISFVRGAEWYIHVEVRWRGRDRVGIGGREGRMKGGRKRESGGGKEGRSEYCWEGGRKGGREEGREGGREGERERKGGKGHLT